MNAIFERTDVSENNEDIHVVENNSFNLKKNVNPREKHLRERQDNSFDLNNEKLKVLARKKEIPKNDFKPKRLKLNPVQSLQVEKNQSNILCI